MSLKSTSAFNGVKVYNCTAGRTVPQWAEDFNSGKVKSLRYDKEFRNRIDLIQDFEFPSASTCIKMSKDGKFIGACGTYKPQIKMFETDQLGMKFERHLDAEAVTFQFLSDDYRKLLLLRADRTIEIHAAYGRHHLVRIPKFGRDLIYDHVSCDAYAVGAGNEAYRLNLDEGRFMSSIKTGLPSINKIAINPVHQLLAMGGANGVVEFWDSRDHTRAGSLDVITSAALTNKALSLKLGAKGCEVTSVAYDDDGLGVAVGTSTGHVLLYDLRRGAPTQWKDHRYGLPIIDVKFHESRNIISTDSKIIKLWNKTSAKAFTSVEPSAPINDVCVQQGLLLVAGEQHRMQAFYCPELGTAPSWASFLDNLTEELEEQTETPLYDDYKFVTREELEDWGLSHLIGTNLLRAYMQGFFMDLRLYNRVRTSSEPYAYEQYMKKQVVTKIDEKRANRITVNKRLPQVNKGLAELLLKAPGKKKQLTKADAAGEAEAVFKNPLGDDRFASLFTKSDFEIDIKSDEFKRLNPNANHRFKKVAADTGADDAENEDRSSDDEEGGKKGTRDARFNRVDDDDGDNSEDEMVYRKGGRGSSLAMAGMREQSAKRPVKGDDEDDDDSDNDEEEGALSSMYPSKRKKIGMYQLKRGLDANTVTQAGSREDAEAERDQRKKAKKATLEERLAAMPSQAGGKGGKGRGEADDDKKRFGEVSFVPTQEVKGRGVIVGKEDRRDAVIVPEGWEKNHKRSAKKLNKSKGRSSKGKSKKGGGGKGKGRR